MSRESSEAEGSNPSGSTFALSSAQKIRRVGSDPRTYRSSVGRAEGHLSLIIVAGPNPADMYRAIRREDHVGTCESMEHSNREPCGRVKRRFQHVQYVGCVVQHVGEDGDKNER